MIRCLTHSLRRNGGDYRDAPVIVTLGDQAPEPSLADRMPWLREHGIALRWVPRDTFLSHSYCATGNQRWQYDYAADVVLLLDADVLIAGPLDELVETVHARQVIAGLIAHVSPFEALARPDGWKVLHDALGIQGARADHEHTGWGYLSVDPRFRFTPAYFNYGVVCAPRGVAVRVGQVIHELLLQVQGQFPGFWYDNQVALSLAVARLGLPYWCLPMRWNFANDPFLEALHAAELPHTRVVHLLRAHQKVAKADVFASLESLEAFARRDDLRVTNGLAQRTIAQVLPALRAEESRAAPLRPAA
jgi:hypothetical protein